MNWRIVFRRMLGGLLIYVLVFPSVVIGYLLSAELKLPSLATTAIVDSVLYISLRIVAFLLGVFWFHRLLRPYSKHPFLAIKVGDNPLFDEGPNLFGRFTVKLALSLIGSSILIGFGLFGVFVFLARLLFNL